MKGWMVPSAAVRNVLNALMEHLKAQGKQVEADDLYAAMAVIFREEEFIYVFASSTIEDRTDFIRSRRGDNAKKSFGWEELLQRSRSEGSVEGAERVVRDETVGDSPRGWRKPGDSL